MTVQVSHSVTLHKVQAKDVHVTVLRFPNPNFPPLCRVTMPHITVFVTPEELMVIAEDFSYAGGELLKEIRDEQNTKG